ncbi:MAG TPA: hypothetical protein VK149_03600 [Sideroxyarcus sp.]|nr:hypothetical protein [Sideroxyarcus sp.]
MNAITEPNRFSTPELKEGEIYAGAIINPDGTGHHIILLDGDNDDADWQTQMDWAKSIGGDLPNRVEQAMLYKNLKDRFQEDAYWSNTKDSNTRFAWGQSFNNGYQDNGSTFNQFRARAVRRVAI